MANSAEILQPILYFYKILGLLSWIGLNPWTEARPLATLSPGRTVPVGLRSLFSRRQGILAMRKLAFLVGLGLGLVALPVWAQGSSTPLPSPTAAATPARGTTPSPQASPSLTADQVTDAQVEQLVRILLELDPLIRKASAQLRETQDEAEYEKIMQRTEAEASRIVEKQGLTVAKYRELMTLANEDPTLNQRVRLRLQELIQEKGSSASPQPANPTPTP